MVNDQSVLYLTFIVCINFLYNISYLCFNTHANEMIVETGKSQSKHVLLTHNGKKFNDPEFLTFDDQLIKVA